MKMLQQASAACVSIRASPSSAKIPRPESPAPKQKSSSLAPPAQVLGASPGFAAESTGGSGPVSRREHVVLDVRPERVCLAVERKEVLLRLVRTVGSLRHENISIDFPGS